MHSKAKKYIEKLELIRHPEGGYFKEVYRSKETLSKECLNELYIGERNTSTSIYFLLEGENKSHFHKLLSDEIWHFYDGSSAAIYLLKDGRKEIKKIGLNLDDEEYPQVLIPKNTWFAAETLQKNSFILVGCTVSPGFDFQDFKLAGKDELLKDYPSESELIERFTLGK